MKALIKTTTTYYPATDGYAAGDTSYEYIEAEFKPRRDMQAEHGGAYTVTDYTEVDPAEWSELIDDEEREDFMTERSSVPEHLTDRQVKRMYGYIRHRK